MKSGNTATSTGMPKGASSVSPATYAISPASHKIKKTITAIAAGQCSIKITKQEKLSKSFDIYRITRYSKKIGVSFQDFIMIAIQTQITELDKFHDNFKGD